MANLVHRSYPDRSKGSRRDTPPPPPSDLAYIDPAMQKHDPVGHAGIRASNVRMYGARVSRAQDHARDHSTVTGAGTAADGIGREPGSRRAGRQPQPAVTTPASSQRHAMLD